MTEDNATPQEQGIPIYDPQRDNPPRMELMIARAASIQAYAHVEQSLAMLFSTLLGTNMEITGIVFFRIVNTRSRIAIFEDLIKKRYTTTYDLFWTSVAKLLQNLDTRRNEIIHWQLVQSLSGGDPPTSIFTLMPPNFWANANRRSISASDLNIFTDKCDFISRLLNIFNLALGGGLDAERGKPWFEIFQQPVVYPPPDTHPLYRKP